MRFPIDHLLPQLSIEAGHDRDNENEHGHTQRHPENRNEGDDRNKSALRLQIAQREEETERQFQIGRKVARKPRDASGKSHLGTSRNRRFVLLFIGCVGKRTASCQPFGGEQAPEPMIDEDELRASLGRRNQAGLLHLAQVFGRSQSLGDTGLLDEADFAVGLLEGQLDQFLAKD